MIEYDHPNDTIGAELTDDLQAAIVAFALHYGFTVEETVTAISIVTLQTVGFQLKYDDPPEDDDSAIRADIFQRGI